MFKDSIEEHIRTIDIDQPRLGKKKNYKYKSYVCRDFIDAYLSEILKGNNSNFDQESLELCCLDLFKAGAETSSTTLLWCILYLVRYPEVQEKCAKELIRVTGEEKPSKVHQLPYCQAVIQEVQRMSCVAPQIMPHRLSD